MPRQSAKGPDYKEVKKEVIKNKILIWESY